jgi:AcrR family transcriptional regulator
VKRRSRPPRTPAPERRSTASVATTSGAPAPARRRGRPAIPPDQQRQRLVEAARRALQQSDFGSVRVSDVIRAAGMSSRSFYDYFDSKEDLLLALIREAGKSLVAEFETIFAAGHSPAVRIDRAVAAYLAAFAGTPLDLERLGESASAPVQKMLREIVREVRECVAANLDLEWRRGTLRRAPDPIVLDVLLLGLLGIASSYMADGRRDEIESLRPTLVQFLLRVWS